MKKTDKNSRINKKILESKKVIREEKLKIKEEKRNLRKNRFNKFKSTKIGKLIFIFKDDKNSYSFSELFVVTLVSLVVGAFACLSVVTIFTGGRNYFKLSKELDKFYDVYETLVDNYYDEVVPNIPSASKAGFAKKSVVVTGIIFDEHPYIAISVANTGGNISTNKQVIKLISHMNDIMTEYENYLNTKEKTS